MDSFTVPAFIAFGLLFVIGSGAVMVTQYIDREEMKMNVGFSWDQLYQEESGYLVSDYLSGLQKDTSELILQGKKVFGLRAMRILLDETYRCIEKEKGERLARAYHLRGVLYENMGLDILAMDNYRTAQRLSRWQLQDLVTGQGAQIAATPAGV